VKCIAEPVAVFVGPASAEDEPCVGVSRVRCIVASRLMTCLAKGVGQSHPVILKMGCPTTGLDHQRQFLHDGPSTRHQLNTRAVSRPSQSPRVRLFSLRVIRGVRRRVKDVPIMDSWMSYRVLGGRANADRSIHQNDGVDMIGKPVRCRDRHAAGSTGGRRHANFQPNAAYLQTTGPAPGVRRRQGN